MKAKLLCVLASFFIFLSTINTFAAPSTVKVVVNGNTLKSDTASVIKNSRTMVPFRALFEALGANDITWHEPTQTVTGSDGKIKVQLVIGSYDINVNGKTITMDTPPMIINSRTMIPLSFVSSSMGAKVEWNPKDYIATVTKSSPTKPVKENKDISKENTKNDMVMPETSGVFDEMPDVPEKTNPEPVQPLPNPQPSPQPVPAPIPQPNSKKISINTLSGYYAIEDLSRGKYVIHFDVNSKATITDISTKISSQGTYSYSNPQLSLNIDKFKSNYTAEIVSWKGQNVLLMKDNSNPTSGSTFAMLEISQDEYKTHLPEKKEEKN